MRTLPSRETSSSNRPPATLNTRRSCPLRVTAYKAREIPEYVEENQTSSPFGLQARAVTLSQNLEIVLFFPERSTTATLPRSSGLTGWSRKAIRSPRGENRGDLIHPVVSYKTLPTGNSSRVFPFTSLTITNRPSGDQSAPSTFVSRSRGAPPPSESRARTSALFSKPIGIGSRLPCCTARSPDTDTDNSRAPGAFSSCELCASRRWVKSWRLFP